MTKRYTLMELRRSRFIKEFKHLGRTYAVGDAPSRHMHPKAVHIASRKGVLVPEDEFEALSSVQPTEQNIDDIINQKGLETKAIKLELEAFGKVYGLDIDRKFSVANIKKALMNHFKFGEPDQLIFDPAELPLIKY